MWPRGVIIGYSGKYNNLTVYVQNSYKELHMCWHETDLSGHIIVYRSIYEVTYDRGNDLLPNHIGVNVIHINKSPYLIGDKN